MSYPNFAALSAAEPSGVAWSINTRLGSALPWTSIAIHGGGIELGTGPVASAVAENLLNYYEFSGNYSTQPPNTNLIISALTFDEPTCENLVGDSLRTLSFHGYPGGISSQVTVLSGLDTVLKARINARLVAAGFTVSGVPFVEVDGADPANICNRNRSDAGVQIEMSSALRNAFFPGSVLDVATINSPARTTLFYTYVNAIRAAINDVVGDTKRPSPDDCIITYAARVVDRQGSVVADVDILTDVEWTRLINDTSTATVTATPDGDCCRQLGSVRSWGHMLNIYRNGRFVWSGPVINAEWKLGKVIIKAADMSAWLLRRVPHENITFEQTDLAYIAQWLIDDAFAPDDPGHTVNIVAPSLVEGGRAYIENVGQTLDHLTDLSDTGLDWTVLGPQFVILPDDWDQSVGSLTDADLPEGLTVAEDGGNLTTRWVVAGGSNKDLIGEAGGVDPFYGLLERYIEQSSVTTQAAAQSTAESRLRSTNVAPVFIDTQEVTISPEAPIDVAGLVPGWSLDMATTKTCRNLGQRLKITGVKVAMSGEGSEEVKVQVAVSGTEA